MINIQAFIVNWEPVYVNVLVLEDQLLKQGCNPTVINSGQSTREHWVSVGDIRYYRQLYKALQLFNPDNEYFLFCTGDISYEDWSDVFSRARQVLSKHSPGVYAPLCMNSAWNYEQTHIACLEDFPGVSIATQTDGIFAILHKDVAKVMLGFFEYVEQRVQLAEFTTGWGVDNMWSSISMCMGKYVLRDLNHTITHPSGSSYDHSRAWHEMNTLLDHFARYARSIGYEDAGQYLDKIFKRKNGNTETFETGYFYKGLP